MIAVTDTPDYHTLQDDAYNALQKLQGDNNAGVGNGWPIGPSIFSGALGPE